jgi:hypothetical protein
MFALFPFDSSFRSWGRCQSQSGQARGEAKSGVLDKTRSKIVKVIVVSSLCSNPGKLSGQNGQARGEAKAWPTKKPVEGHQGRSTMLQTDS